jgi:hypothetical protein
LTLCFGLIMEIGFVGKQATARWQTRLNFTQRCQVVL